LSTASRCFLSRWMAHAGWRCGAGSAGDHVTTGRSYIQQQSGPGFRSGGGARQQGTRCRGPWPARFSTPRPGQAADYYEIQHHAKRARGRGRRELALARSLCRVSFRRCPSEFRKPVASTSGSGTALRGAALDRGWRWPRVAASVVCPPNITDYEAGLILNKMDTGALAAAVAEVERCIPGVGDPTNIARTIANEKLGENHNNTGFAINAMAALG
jgi:hypothetical protein